MQVVEKSNEGLSRVIAVTIPVAELNQKLDAKLKEVAPQMKLKGFRPGKVPTSHVKKTFGRDLMGEIINDALNTSSQKALDDAKVRPAAPAEMKLTSDMDKVIAGQDDLAYEMSLEVMPEFTPVDIKTLKLKRPTYEATDADLDEALTELAGQDLVHVRGQLHLGRRGRTQLGVVQGLLAGGVQRLIDDLAHQVAAESLLDVRRRDLAGAEALELHLRRDFLQLRVQLLVQLRDGNGHRDHAAEAFGGLFDDLHGRDSDALGRRLRGGARAMWVKQ